MIDREKVIKGLHQHCEGSMFDRCGECPYYEVADEPFQCKDALLMDALALLKEQEAVVKCKDCIHFAQDNIPTDGCGFCELLSRTYCGNDYCSYGERRTDDA